MKNLVIACVSYLLPVYILCAQNPVIGSIGMSDPHVRVFNDTIYLYTGHDSDPEDKTWVMKNWRVFSSTNLTNWTLRETISPTDNYMDDNSTDCWAGDAASRNGKYYFYFSDRKRGVGVMVADSPTGPFTDPLGKPLVAPMHDPTILIDDNLHRTPYIIYGDKSGGGFHVARLNEDMISLAEAPAPIKIYGEEWENAPEWMDKNYIFKRNGIYYLSWGGDYAVSDNIYGPYTCAGQLGKGYHLNEFAHGSFFEWKGQFYHIWCYYIQPGFKYRESIITYCHVDDDGNIVTDTKFLDKHFNNGVGQYNAAWESIEAEWFYEISGNIQKQGDVQNGFMLTNIKDGDWIKFANVSFKKEYHSCTAKVAFTGNEGFLQVTTDSVNGNVIGEATFPRAESSEGLQEVSFNTERFTGRKDIYFVFRGSENSHLTLDWYRFE